jgi:hypothetical protein
MLTGIAALFFLAVYITLTIINLPCATKLLQERTLFLLITAFLLCNCGSSWAVLTINMADTTYADESILLICGINLSAATCVVTWTHKYYAGREREETSKFRGRRPAIGQGVEGCRGNLRYQLD